MYKYSQHSLLQLESIYHNMVSSSAITLQNQFQSKQYLEPNIQAEPNTTLKLLSKGFQKNDTFSSYYSHWHVLHVNVFSECKKDY